MSAAENHSIIRSDKLLRKINWQIFWTFPLNLRYFWSKIIPAFCLLSYHPFWDFLDWDFKTHSNCCIWPIFNFNTNLDLLSCLFLSSNKRSGAAAKLKFLSLVRHCKKLISISLLARKQECLRYAIKKKYGIILELFPYRGGGGGATQFPKLL